MPCEAHIDVNRPTPISGCATALLLRPRRRCEVFWSAWLCVCLSFCLFVSLLACLNKSPLPLTDLRDELDQLMLNIPYRIIW